MAWTEERVATLKTLWNEGRSASQIAARLGGVTRAAVLGKVWRLGLARDPNAIGPPALHPIQIPPPVGDPDDIVAASVRENAGQTDEFKRDDACLALLWHRHPQQVACSLFSIREGVLRNCERRAALRRIVDRCGPPAGPGPIIDESGTIGRLQPTRSNVLLQTTVLDMVLSGDKLAVIEHETGVSIQSINKLIRPAAIRRLASEQEERDAA